MITASSKTGLIYHDRFLDHDTGVGHAERADRLRAVTARLRQSAIQFLGKNNVIELPIRMTAEDFAYYSQKIPACFYRLGTGGPDGKFTSPVHTPTFDVDENALETGAGMMAWAALEALTIG